MKIEKDIESKMLCVFCSAEFTPKMLYDYESSTEYNSLNPDNHWDSIDKMEVIVKCDNCGKVCYKKEAEYN